MSLFCNEKSNQKRFERDFEFPSRTLPLTTKGDPFGNPFTKPHLAETPKRDVFFTPKPSQAVNELMARSPRWQVRDKALWGQLAYSTRRMLCEKSNPRLEGTTRRLR